MAPPLLDFLLDNHGVPGDWITGHRMLDIVALPLLAACLIPLVRQALLTWFYQPLGQRVLLGAAKKSDAPLAPGQLAASTAKWNESCWKMTVFGAFTAAALAVVAPEPYFWSPEQYWGGATAFPLNYPVPLKVTAFYVLETGFYLQAIPYLCFIETRRKDWAESFAHHVVTLVMLYYSYYCNFTRPGIVVMLLHDVSDIFLEAAKLARYARAQGAATGLFALFALSWIVCRVVVYPYLFIHRFLVDPITLVAVPHNIDPQPHYALFGTLFMLLYALHLYWTYLIFKVIARQLRGGDTADIREEEDDD